VSGSSEFRFAQVDTGQLYLRHRVCGEIDWRPVDDGLAVAEEVARTHVCPAPESVPKPTRCPCGHSMDSDLRCLNGRIYGPCDSEHCDGPCTDTYGYCNADGCLCEEEA
jgi:hypothetical protein